METPDADNPAEADAHWRGTAYHEAGHAVVTWSCNIHVDSVILRERGVDSATMRGPANHLLDELAVLAAGREAERMFDSLLPEWRSDRDSTDAINAILRVSPALDRMK